MAQLIFRNYLLIAVAAITVIVFMRIYLKSRRGGLHRVAGTNIFGVEWVIDCADVQALQKLNPLYELVRMDEDEKVRTATALSGSAAYMGRVNPYPGDVDFTEIVLVKVANVQEAAGIFVVRLQQNIEKILSIAHTKFSELKIGADKDTGKGLKWELADVRRGCKELKDGEDTLLGNLTLSDAALQGQIIKLDLIARVDGNWKEVTKVFRFAFQPESSRDIRDIVLLTPENLGETIYQELYFSRKEARLSALISKVSEKGGFSHPHVMKKYRDLMDVEIAHYGALGMADKISHLKLLKRWFNKLRMDRDHESIDKLTKIFRSTANAVNELKEMIVILVLAIDKDLLSTQEISGQLDYFNNFLEIHGNQLPAEDVQSYSRVLLDVRGQIDSGNYTTAAERLENLASRLEGWIEGRAKTYLLNEILHPYAENLGIHIDEDTTFEHKDLFKGVTKGDKTLYLINRYLRHDSRVVQKRFEKGQSITRRGDKAESCYVILEGSATVTDPGEGDASQHIRDVGPLIFIGEIALIHEGGRRTADIAAATEVESLEIPRVVFQELMQDESFRLFIEFLSTDRLMEDGVRGRQKLSSLGISTLRKRRNND
jgi:CRP-like cAMP-binding protein